MIIHPKIIMLTMFYKVFEYQSVVRNTGFSNHFPVHEMTCAAKLRYNIVHVLYYHDIIVCVIIVV